MRPLIIQFNLLQWRIGEVLRCSVPCAVSWLILWHDHTLSSDGETGDVEFVWFFGFKRTCLPFTGSGIYAPHSPKVYHHDMETESGKILFAEVDSHPRNSSTSPPAVNWSAYATSITPFPGPKNSFRGLISRDEFNFTKLSESAGNLTVCQKELCCHLSYRMLGKEEDEVYVLGAFAGLHGRRRREYWQVISSQVKTSVWVWVNSRVNFSYLSQGIKCSFLAWLHALPASHTHALGLIIWYLQGS